MTVRTLRYFAFGLLSFASVALGAAPGQAAEGSEADAETASSEGEPSSTAEAEEEGARAGSADTEKSGETAGDAERQKSGHGGQFGLRVGLSGGLRMIVRYEQSTYCRQPDDLSNLVNEPKFCGHVAPFALDVALSFAVADALEPFAWARLGLGGEEQTDTNPVVALGAGARIYTMSDAPIKVFIEPAVALELEDGQGHVPWSWVPDGYGTDFLVHLAVGPQFDFSRHLGLYVTGGITTGVIRAIHTTLEAQIGLQGRYP